MVKFTIKQTEELRNMPILDGEIEFEPRESNVLLRNKCSTVGDVLDRYNSYESLMSLRGVGKKTVHNILQKIFDYNFNTMSEKEKEDYIIDLVMLNLGEAS